MRQSKGAMQRGAKAAALKYTEVDMQRITMQTRHETLREIKDRYAKEWNKELYTHCVLNALSFLTAASCDVLVTDFGWAPYRDEKSRIAKFAKCLEERINEKSEGDLLAYAQEVYDKTGIGFDTLED